MGSHPNKNNVLKSESKGIAAKANNGKLVTLRRQSRPPWRMLYRWVSYSKIVRSTGHLSQEHLLYWNCFRKKNVQSTFFLCEWVNCLSKEPGIFGIDVLAPRRFGSEVPRRFNTDTFWRCNILPPMKKILSDLYETRAFFLHTNFSILYETHLYFLQALFFHNLLLKTFDWSSFSRGLCAQTQKACQTVQSVVLVFLIGIVSGPRSFTLC